MHDGDQSFGRQLASVEERDIDLLLLEELQINDEFVMWIGKQVGLSDVRRTGAWHSVTGALGETDLLLGVTTGGRRIGVMIENKISAVEQFRQAARYEERGQHAVSTAVLDDYITVICAPQRYLDHLPPSSSYRFRVTYEEIADWFSHRTDRRSAWRAHVLREAIEQGRRGYTMVVSQVHSSFHLSYWNHVRFKHPSLIMRRPSAKGAGSTWVSLKAHDFPPGVRIWHKMDLAVVDLSFERTRVEELAARGSDWPSTAALVQKGQSACISIAVPSINIQLGFAEQLEAIEAALAAAHALMPLCRLLSDSQSER